MEEEASRPAARSVFGSLCEHRALWVLILSALVVFSANLGHLSLKSYDDCYYAAKGLEMWRSGPGFTVTQGGAPDFQNPPLTFWLLAGSFSLLGDNDLAARLPSLVLSILVLLMIYRVGLLLFGRRAGLVAVAALLLTPMYVMYSRRCMTEMPLTAGVVGAIWLYVEGLGRPRLHALIALPLAVGILSKSVLGLMPVLVFAGTALSPRLRPMFRNPWLWLGVLGGLALGASWSVQQYLVHGSAFLQGHWGFQIVGRATGESSGETVTLIRAIAGYPGLLFEQYEPVILTALAGLVFLMARGLRRTPPGAEILIFWLVLPVVALSLMSTYKPRYLFALLPAMALLTGYLFQEKLPRLIRCTVCCVAPAAALLSAVVFWAAPGTLTGDENQIYKQTTEIAASDGLRGAVVPYFGNPRTKDVYWKRANAMRRYWNAELQYSGDDRRSDEGAAYWSAAAAAHRAMSLEHCSLIVEEYREPEIGALGVEYSVVLDGGAWRWIRFPKPRESASEAG
ncbi:MAG: glycosyltransferase family 39 protein [Candidatus Eisenbacteria bacterium]|nr:glycosyltransferase family 39 protein [Candidatus Eisenbacteria bacterium]